MKPTQIASLQRAALFTNIAPDEYQKLIGCLAPHTKIYNKNEIILHTGAAVTHIGIILSGGAYAYLEHKDGSQVLISHLFPLNTIGEVLVSTQIHKSPVTIYAMTEEVTVVYIKYNRLFSTCAAACKAHGMFLQNMLKHIGDKYFQLFDRINLLREKSLRARILAYLCTLKENENATVVTLPFTKTMLANYLLVNRSALSRELRKMEQDGLIVVSGRSIRVKN